MNEIEPLIDWPARAMNAEAERDALNKQLGRTRIGTHSDDCHTFGPRHYECAMRKLEGAEARVEKLRAALEPFAEMTEAYADRSDLSLVISADDFAPEQRFERDTIHVVDFRNARAALEADKPTRGEEP